MQVKGFKRISGYVVSLDIDGKHHDLPVDIEPASVLDNGDYALHLSRDGAMLALGYLANDIDCPHPLEDCDGMGHIYEASRYSPGLIKYLKARGLDGYGQRDESIEPDPYAVLLDCYEHGGKHWSLSGGGMQCQFDTANGSGVWVPDSYLREDLDGLPEDEREEQAREYAKQALEEYNKWLRGDCYGCVVEVYKLDEGKWEQVPEQHESVWGFIGADWALAELRSMVTNLVPYLEREVADA